jgi:dihydropteroate synthase
MRSSPPTPPKSRGSGFLELLAKPRATPLIMGVVNATTDSFYAASRAGSEKAAIEAALRLAEEGADIVDIGGQSTRPGSDPVSEKAELERTVCVVEAVRRRSPVAISIDTDKAAVARACREAGAGVLNDVSALRGDPGMLAEALAFEAVVLMHRGGASPKTMQVKPSYGDVVAEVKEFLRERAAAFVKAGGERRRVLIDPGIGFGKDLEHNLALLRALPEFSKLASVVLGASRKSFLGRITPDDGPEARLGGSIAVALWAASKGCAVVRVHDVDQTRRALEASAAIEGLR